MALVLARTSLLSLRTASRAVTSVGIAADDEAAAESAPMIHPRMETW